MQPKKKKELPKSILTFSSIFVNVYSFPLVSQIKSYGLLSSHTPYMISQCFLLMTQPSRCVQTSMTIYHFYCSICSLTPPSSGLLQSLQTGFPASTITFPLNTDWCCFRSQSETLQILLLPCPKYSNVFRILLVTGLCLYRDSSSIQNGLLHFVVSGHFRALECTVVFAWDFLPCA